MIIQKNKFDYNKDLLEKIRNKEFRESEFLKLGENITKSLTLNSIKDNNKFDIKSVELLYSMPINSFTLVNDEMNKIYLIKVKSFKDKVIDTNSDEFKSYINKLNSNIRNDILKSYDLFLNDKYNVVINQKTIDRVKNFFQ